MLIMFWINCLVDNVFKKLCKVIILQLELTDRLINKCVDILYIL